MADDHPLPETLTLDEAYRAAFFLTDLYVEIESAPCEGLVLYRQYLQSDPARWEDWITSVRKATAGETQTDPLAENLLRD